MPSVLENAAVGPVPPLFPQLPHVSQGDSSTRSITVALGVVPGVGVGAGEGTGVGAGAEVAVVEVVLPPQDTNANIKARIRTVE